MQLFGNRLVVRFVVLTPRAYPKVSFYTVIGLVTKDLNIVTQADYGVGIVTVKLGDTFEVRGKVG